MKVILCSDSHGAFSAAEATLEKTKNAAAVLFLGDGAEEWEDLACIHPEMRLLPVCGNCDRGSRWPVSRVVELGGHRIFCTHGHAYAVKSGDLSALHRAAAAEGCDIIAYGHTHQRRIEYQDGIWCLNPGSLRYSDSCKNGYVELVLDGKNVVPIEVTL